MVGFACDEIEGGNTLDPLVEIEARGEGIFKGGEGAGPLPPPLGEGGEGAEAREAPREVEEEEGGEGAGAREAPREVVVGGRPREERGAEGPPRAERGEVGGGPREERGAEGPPLAERGAVRGGRGRWWWWWCWWWWRG